MLAQNEPIQGGPIRRDPLYEQALARLKKKREFWSHLLAFVLVNGFLATVWALTSNGDTFFWPMFPLFGWGIGLVFHAWDAFGSEPTEEQIRREAERIARRT